MDFQQAQAGFQWLEEQFRTGAISQEKYQAGLNELRVVDAWGRLWMQQEHTGIWHCYSDGKWVAAQPPVQPGTVPPPPGYPAPLPVQQPAYQSYSPVKPAARDKASLENPYGDKKETSVFFKYVRAILIWLAIWLIIGLAYWLFYGQSHGTEGIAILAGIGLAAVLSLALMLWSMRGSWKGQVVDIRILQEQQNDDDSNFTVDVRYAFIRQTNGKMRKERAMPDWQPGDWLEKRQGENWVRKLK